MFVIFLFFCDVRVLSGSPFPSSPDAFKRVLFFIVVVFRSAPSSLHVREFVDDKYYRSFAFQCRNVSSSHTLFQWIGVEPNAFSRVQSINLYVSTSQLSSDSSSWSSSSPWSCLVYCGCISLDHRTLRTGVPEWLSRVPPLTSPRLNTSELLSCHNGNCVAF